MAEKTISYERSSRPSGGGIVPSNTVVQLTTMCGEPAARISEVFAEDLPRQTPISLVDKGMVTLSGHVKAWNERQRAETAVWNIPGVTEVVGRLSIA